MSVEMEYEEIQGILDRILGKNINFESLVTQLTENGQNTTAGTWLSAVGSLFLEQVKNHGQNIVYFLFLILSASILSVIAKAFRNRQISDMGFYMISLLMFVIMMRSFGVCYSLAENVVKDLIDFMKVLMPAYLMATAFAKVDRNFDSAIYSMLRAGEYDWTFGKRRLFYEREKRTETFHFVSVKGHDGFGWRPADHSGDDFSGN